MSTNQPAKPGLLCRLPAMALERCPRCLKGHVFHGLVSMHETCPRCGYRFEREPGYFTGALV